MKRAFLALSLIAGSLAAAPAVHAQSLDPLAPLKAYASKALPRCPGGALTLERSPATGPTNFAIYVATLRSSDQYCGAQKYLLHSPKSQQILLGSVIPLPTDDRPIHVRVTETASRLLGHAVQATVAPFPLPDGIKAVSIVRSTPFGPFSYGGFVDQSGKYLIVGMRGMLTREPAATLRETLGVATAARRGDPKAKVEIIEVSDFQCPTCARAHEKVEPLIRQNLSRINYVRVDLPLFEAHQWAVPAAMGARAIQRVAPAKYWEYVDFVFKNQESINSRKFDDVIREFASDHDLNWTEIQKIYASKTERATLLEQVSRAFNAGIASTPTFIVNGQIMGFGPDGTFTIDAIKSALGSPAKKPAAKPAKK